MSSSEILSLQGKSQRWEYTPSYQYTSKVWNSNGKLAKAVRYSVLGIVILALAETVAEIVKLPLKLIGNQFGLYNYSLFRSKEAVQDLKLIEQDIKEKAKPILEPEKKIQAVNKKMPGWKKVLLIAGGILGVSLLGWGGYSAYLYYFKLSGNKPFDLKQAFDEQQLAQQSRTCPIGNIFEKPACAKEAEAQFVEKYVKDKKCPSMETFIEDQEEKGYWGWSLDNIRKLFGSERDLSLAETRNFYHSILKHIPKNTLSHPKYSNESLDKAPREVVKDLSDLRNTARDYAKRRSYQWTQEFLENHEPRDKGFEFYWKKYGGNSEKIIEGSMKSNSFWDNLWIHKIGDIANGYMPKFLRPYARKLILAS